MKHRLNILLTLISGLFLLASAAQAADPVRVGYIRVMDDAQVMVAYEGGFYKKHGLDAELIEFGSGTDLIKAIVGGQLDLGVLGFSNAFTWASRGADLKIVGGAQHGYHSIVVRKDSGINSVADLKGRTLASQKEGSTADIVLKGVTLKDAGLTPRDLQILGVQPAVAVQSLVGNRVEAAFLFEPYDRIAQLVAPVKQIYEIGEVWPFPCMVVITSADALEKKRDIIDRAQDAQREAIELLENKPEEAAKLIAHYFIAEPTLKTLEHGDVAREEVIRQAIETQTFSPILTDAEVDRMRELAVMMEELNIIRPGSLDVDAVLDLTWQQERNLK